MTCEELRRIMAHRGPDQYRALEAQICGGAAADVVTMGPRRPAAAPTPPPGKGVGTELTRLLAELKLHTECSRCRDLAAKMDRLGIAWVHENRAEIIASLQQGRAGATRMQRLKAMGAAVLSGLAFRLNPLDPINSLLDEAIRRTESS